MNGLSGGEWSDLEAASIDSSHAGKRANDDDPIVADATWWAYMQLHTCSLGMMSQMLAHYRDDLVVHACVVGARPLEGRWSCPPCTGWGAAV